LQFATTAGFSNFSLKNKILQGVYNIFNRKNSRLANKIFK